MSAVAEPVQIRDRDRADAQAGNARDPIAACLGIDARGLRSLVGDLYERRMAVYWTDFLLSILIGYGALRAFHLFDPLSPAAAVTFACAVFGCYRATIFVHEIAHARGRGFASFRFVWNVLCGVPLFIPSFLYEDHKAHHATRTFGSADDGEYLALARLPRSSAALLIGRSLLVPAGLMFRFVVLAPLSWFLPRLRAGVLARASALMIIDADYRRTVHPSRIPRRWLVQEAACFLWGVALLLGLASGFIPLARIGVAYAVFAGVSLLNALRLVVAHRYLGTGRPMTLAEQVLDSNTFPDLAAELWAPVGLRYHAVHHLLPSLPYHALPEAHRRIIERVPMDSPYRSTMRHSMFSVLAELFCSRREAGLTA